METIILEFLNIIKKKWHLETKFYIDGKQAEYLPRRRTAKKIGLGLNADKL